MDFLKPIARISISSLVVFSTITSAQTDQSPPHLFPALPQAVQEIYPAIYQEKIWVAGGISSHLPQNQGQMTNQVHFWEPGMTQWQAASPLPEGRHHTYLQAIGEKLFAFGGFINSDKGQWKNTSDVLLLDKASSSWKKIAQMPAPLSETVAAVINGKIHLAGGRSPNGKENSQWQHSTDVSWHWVFDPVSYQFTNATPLPGARNSAASIQFNNRWIVIGGRTVGGANLTEVLEYQPEQDQWKTLPAMPEGRAGHAAAIIEDKIQVFGGEHENGVYTSVLQFDIAKNRWQSIGTWPQARHGLGAINLNRKLFLIGGAADTGLKNTSANVDEATKVLNHNNPRIH